MYIISIKLAPLFCYQEVNDIILNVLGAIYIEIAYILLIIARWQHFRNCVKW